MKLAGSGLGDFFELLLTPAVGEEPVELADGGRGEGGQDVPEVGKAWRMIRGDKTYKVELHFDSEFADTLAGTHWHQTQTIEWLEDNSILFRCEVEGLDEIIWWVLVEALAAGDRAVVVAERFKISPARLCQLRRQWASPGTRTHRRDA